MYHFNHGDDWFERKYRLEYAEENLSDLLPHEEYVRRMEAKIVKVVLANRDSGIAHLQLAHIVQIDRKNLTPYMKRLIRKGLIKRGKGKQGKYYPATKNYRGPTIAADLLGKGLASVILANEDFPVDSPFFKLTDTETAPEKALFIFSQKVGAIVTYLLIQSMNPDNNITYDAKNDEEKDLNVERWIDDAVSSLRHFLLPIFKELSVSLMTYFDSFIRDFTRGDASVDLQKGGLSLLNYKYNRPFYTLEQKFISGLLTAFSNSYPSIAAILEDLLSRLPNAVAREVSSWEYLAYSSKQQSICEHHYKKLPNWYLPIKSKHYLMHCSKCHINKYYKIAS